MLPKLLILSDLWGSQKSTWVSEYSRVLQDNFQIQYYDCLELAEIKDTNASQETLHKQFINGGIDTAVNALLRAEKSEVKVLAFSIGGTIAWKAALQGLKIKSLVAVSSTRLRYETIVPKADIKLIYGANDPNIPQLEWMKNYHLNVEIIKGKDHDLYTESELAVSICQEFKNNSTL